MNEGVASGSRAAIQDRISDMSMLLRIYGDGQRNELKRSREVEAGEGGVLTLEKISRKAPEDAGGSEAAEMRDDIGGETRAAPSGGVQEEVIVQRKTLLANLRAQVDQHRNAARRSVPEAVRGEVPVRKRRRCTG